MPSMGILIINTLGPKSAQQRCSNIGLDISQHAADFCNMGFLRRENSWS